VLRGARAFARDFARDSMPPGYLWDVCDFVPQIVDASLTGRGAWRWGSNPLGADVETGILANFVAGEQLLVQDANGRLSQIDPVSLAVTDRGALPHGLQNPIQVFDATVWFDRDGLQPPQVVGSSGGPSAIDASAAKARYGTVWGGYVMVGNVPGHEDTLYFGPPGPKTTGAWDTNALQQTDNAITGLAALRSLGLVFHASSVERLRGTSVPSTAAGDPGDLTLEPLFRRVGCSDARAIAYWNENVLFADEHGVHITDGAVVRNLATQGSISSYWRPLYQNRTSLAATVFLDYYIISVVRSDGIADTLVCDLNTRQWFRFSNLASIAMIASGGSSGMERIWGSIKGTQRLARLGPCFFPDLTQGLLVDDNGVPVMPEMQTPWYRLGPEGRKRIRFAYLSYDARISTALLSGHPAPWRAPLEDEVPEETISNENAPVLNVGYIRSPQDPSYISIGQLPSTSGYSRFRLPVNQAPYGLAFQVKQTAQTAALRVFDFALEAQGTERSRL
jgi:hypothetical protein